jgi:tRNA-modifying protein YgfZ
MTAVPHSLQFHPSLAQIRVQGSDAASFLNAQLTRRVDNLAEGEIGLAAWCNAKGRVLALFRVTRLSDSFALGLPASMLPLTLPRLRLFVLRAKVQLEESNNSNRPEDDGRLADILADILAGIPQVYPETRELFLPQMLDLERLGGIDFKKGCYPGQEIVARTQYLGKLKRQLYRFSMTGDAEPKPGSNVVTAEDHSGTVVDAARDDQGSWQLLAVIPNEAKDASWRLYAPDGVNLRLETPS